MVLMTNKLPAIEYPPMKTYKRHRFPPEVISNAVWLYQRINLSHRHIAHQSPRVPPSGHSRAVHYTQALIGANCCLLYAVEER